jgi:tetratricopeptide (TPR) repeat protein
VLNQSGKFEDIIKLMPDIKRLKLDESQKLKIKLIELNTERQTSSDADGIIAKAQNILSETQDSAVGASIWMIIGDTLAGKKRWEEALMAYLRVTVFYGTQVQRVPDAEIASARCLAKMRRYDDAATYYKRLVETYPGRRQPLSWLTSMACTMKTRRHRRPVTRPLQRMLSQPMRSQQKPPSNPTFPNHRLPHRTHATPVHANHALIPPQNCTPSRRLRRSCL